MSARTPEGKVKQKCVAELKRVGAWYCFPVATGYGSSGVPDILACVNGLFLAIECKTPGNRPTALQQMQLDAIKVARGISMVYDGSTPAVDELRRVLNLLTSEDL